MSLLDVMFALEILRFFVSFEIDVFRFQDLLGTFFVKANKATDCKLNSQKLKVSTKPAKIVNFNFSTEIFRDKSWLPNLVNIDLSNHIH